MRRLRRSHLQSCKRSGEATSGLRRPATGANIDGADGGSASRRMRRVTLPFASTPAAKMRIRAWPKNDGHAAWPEVPYSATGEPTCCSK
jgi:hypothetical protein